MDAPLEFCELRLFESGKFGLEQIIYDAINPLILTGDDTTPLGSYRIGWINKKSRYQLFFGLSYPSMHDARRALFLSAIDVETYRSLVRADISKRVPPQHTALGGGIGIHGLGRADSQIHSAMNWTHGCIALTNEQIDGLSRWAKKGIVVTIR